ncbi:UNVERIFIED_CONTAM: Histone-lysine N-methyltransferase SUVR4 [Sesamum latifolium]|uniref:Histone-lysine N-methyltransferase SUVR4 n=1 Tax=Sesamum latifolium TaxID=2727402 RepID=A0AAW2XUZ0_9LAMI
MLRLMKEVCECFLAAGTTSTYTEDVNPENVVSSLGISEDPDSEAGPAKGIDHQLSLCSKSLILNDSVRIQNLFEVSPQIPRFFGSVHLDLSRCRISLTVDVNVSSKKERSIMELNSSTPSSSRMMIVQKQHCYHYIEDITKGQEAYGISLINEINEDRCPTFNYISENVTYQNAYVFMTPEQKGWGLRTLDDLPKGAFICEYVGEVVTNRELFQRNMQSTVYRHIFPVLLDAGWSSGGVLKDEEALCLDAAVYGNVARFINHRVFDANLVQILLKSRPQIIIITMYLAFFTTRQVNAMEELTWDYGIDFNDYQPAKAFHCYCGSKFCRDHKSI